MHCLAQGGIINVTCTIEDVQTRDLEKRMFDNNAIKVLVTMIVLRVGIP